MCYSKANLPPQCQLSTVNSSHVYEGERRKKFLKKGQRNKELAVTEKNGMKMEKRQKKGNYERRKC